MVYIISWLFFGIIGMAISLKKGEGFLGLVFGIVFGPIGILLALASSGNRFPCPFCKEKITQGAIICPHCRQSLNEKINARKETSFVKLVGVGVMIVIGLIFVILVTR